MSSCKLNNLCLIATLLLLLLLLLTLTSSARHVPSSPGVVVTSMKAVQHEGLKDAEVEKVMVDENCEGVGEDECLMRRTLAAHIDYIYTQKNNP